MIRNLVVVGIALVVVPVGGLALLSLLAKPPTNLGVKDGRLARCPSSPNCVCSFDTDTAHGIEPLAYTGSPEKALRMLKALIPRLPRTVLVEERESYLRVECRTALFRFVDDVEFLIEPATSKVHWRAAARSGYSDGGANRRRLELFRQEFQALNAATPE